MTFEQELQQLINRYDKESESHTPDYILAEYLVDCLNAFDRATKVKDKHFGIKYKVETYST